MHSIGCSDPLENKKNRLAIFLYGYMAIYIYIYGYMASSFSWGPSLDEEGAGAASSSESTLSTFNPLLSKIVTVANIQSISYNRHQKQNIAF